MLQLGGDLGVFVGSLALMGQTRMGGSSSRVTGTGDDSGKKGAVVGLGKEVGSKPQKTGEVCFKKGLVRRC